MIYQSMDGKWITKAQTTTDTDFDLILFGFGEMVPKMDEAIYQTMKADIF